ncbi:TBC1 domain family member 10B-like, partial [Cetorhinus maximus]
PPAVVLADRPPAAPPAAGRPRSPPAERARPPASPRGPGGEPTPDAVSLADTASLYGQVDSVSMYGTAESLLQEDGSSLGSDSELNGSTASSRRTDKYGFLGGTQFCGGQESGIPVDVARHRELKWLEMLSRWDKWVVRRFDKVKLRCRKGIPSSLRARAWQQLSHSKQLMDQNPGKFEDLDRQQGDPKWLDIIEKDLHRQFPFHEMFALRGGHGQQDLYRILKAYTIYRPEEGYCQAQAPVAAVLLMHMPAEVRETSTLPGCDYSLVAVAVIINNFDYYSLIMVRLDGCSLIAMNSDYCGP